MSDYRRETMSDEEYQSYLFRTMTEPEKRRAYIQRLRDAASAVLDCFDVDGMSVSPVEPLGSSHDVELGDAIRRLHAVVNTEETDD